MIEEVTLTPAMVARDLAQALGERTYAAACLLVRAVREIGPEAVSDLAGRALFIEATGGLPLGEPWNRKRTLGGVFFVLLKGELDDEQHRRVFGRVRKAPKPAQTEGLELPEIGTQVEPIAPAPKPVKPKPAPPAPDPSRPCAACEQPTAVVGKFHFGRAGKRYLCAPCADLGFVFSPSGDVQRPVELVA
jgi:hypothetical protein